LPKPVVAASLLIVSKENKFGRAIEAEGKIFCAPFNADRVLVIDIAQNRAVRSYTHCPRPRPSKTSD
jgi:hypothetical protein